MEFSSQNVTELASALLRVQARLKPVTKDRRNEFIGNNYATLLNIMDVCKALLLEERIWLTQYNVEAEPGHLGLVTKLTHVDSGQWQAGLSVVPLPKQDPQGYGIAQTYTRRYALSAMLGIVTAEDDQLDTDGEFLPTPVSKPAPAPPRRQNHSENRKSAASPSRDPRFSFLPEIDGVTFAEVIDQSTGKKLVFASGKTVSNKDELKNHGFRWSPERKTWWRESAAS